MSDVASASAMWQFSAAQAHYQSRLDPQTQDNIRRKKPQHFARSIAPKTKPSPTYMNTHSKIPITSYFWGEEDWNAHARQIPRHRGYVEAANIVGDGGFENIESLVSEALDNLSQIYAAIESPDETGRVGVVNLRLSDQLQKWKNTQHEAGRVLPQKGFGLARATEHSIRLFNAEDWPEPLLTSNTLFGVGWANFCIGAFDARTLYSNYCCDIAFYYEHGFDKIFPEFEPVFQLSGNDDRHAAGTPAGIDRRKAASLGVRYIRSKVALETKFQARLSSKSAFMDRRAAQVLSFAESSLIGMAAEAITRGYDPADVFADMVFSSPATDVVDIGSDISNSEVMNSFLNTRDIAGTGIVTEENLRAVYDAYAHTCALILTERWSTPTAIMCSQLYIWHILDDRHYFLRRAVLGWDKVRKTQPDQREGDMDEVFDEAFHTTGFSRPLRGACSAEETCDQVTAIMNGHPDHAELLQKLWSILVLEPLNYARAGVVDNTVEKSIETDLQEIMAECWSEGLVYEVCWFICHASHHAWQVNFLMEASMFGSLLDDGCLNGKLDRAN